MSLYCIINKAYEKIITLTEVLVTDVDIMRSTERKQEDNLLTSRCRGITRMWSKSKDRHYVITRLDCSHK